MHWLAAANQPKLTVLKCAVVVCCHLNITDFHKLHNHLWRTRREKCDNNSTLPPGCNERNRTNEIERTKSNERNRTNEIERTKSNERNRTNEIERTKSKNERTNERTKAVTCQLKCNIRLFVHCSLHCSLLRVRIQPWRLPIQFYSAYLLIPALVGHSTKLLRKKWLIKINSHFQWQSAWQTAGHFTRFPHPEYMDLTGPD